MHVVCGSVACTQGRTRQTKHPDVGTRNCSQQSHIVFGQDLAQFSCHASPYHLKNGIGAGTEPGL
jgi:hypothetical protein